MSFKQILVCLFIFYALISSGSRAPLIACLVTSILFVASQENFSKTRLFLIGSITALSFLFASVVLDNYVFETNFYSLSARQDLLNFVWNLPISLSGNGLSSFGRIYLGADVNYYPHNILAEMYVEYGIFGILFIVLVISAVAKTYHRSIPGALALYYLINAMSSGDLPGNGPLLLSVFVALNLYYFQKQSISHVTARNAYE